LIRHLMEIDMTTYTGTIYYRNAKSYGVGRTAHDRHSRIVGGWRGEIIGGLAEGHSIYTGVCETRDEVKRELITHLKRLGLTGTLKF
jgi:hypothetical protein